MLNYKGNEKRRKPWSLRKKEEKAYNRKVEKITGANKKKGPGTLGALRSLTLLGNFAGINRAEHP